MSRMKTRNHLPPRCCGPVCIVLAASFWATGCPPRDATTTPSADAASVPANDLDAGRADAAAARDASQADASHSSLHDASVTPSPSDASIPEDVDAGSITDVSTVSDGGAGADASVHMSEPDAGITPPRRDACTTDSDCASGRCEALPEGGQATRYCLVVPEVSRVSCEFTSELDSLNECCEDDECDANGSTGICVDFSYRYCGGPPPPEANLCRYHDCQTDVDCGAGRACMPAGAFGAALRKCVQASCRADVDCLARTGGQCRPMRNGPCGTLSGFFCTYDDDPCREDADCPSTFGDGQCVPTDEGTRCEESFPPP